jgi:hypothetical protein
LWPAALDCAERRNGKILLAAMPLHCAGNRGGRVRTSPPNLINQAAQYALCRLRQAGLPPAASAPRGQKRGAVAASGAGPSPAPVDPWQEAQFWSYIAAPRRTVSLVLGNGLLSEL